ncbi:MAG: PAS domain-containing protein, partial [Desulfomonilia bacterium]
MQNVYQEIVEGLPVLICRFLPVDGTITLVNEAYCRYFRKTREDLIGTSFLSLIPEGDRAVVKQHFTSLTRDNPLTTSEHHVNTPSGIRWQRWTHQALFDENGIIREYQSVGQDITEQKTYEQALSQKEETLIDGERRYREILENIEEGYYEVDLKGNFTFFNDSMCRILGYPCEELLGMNNMDLMDSENGERVYRTFNSVFRTGIPSKACDLKLTRKNGATCFLEASVSLVRDRDGNAQGFRG